MKIGIMSDSHDNLKMVDMAVKIFLERGVQHVFHAGDIIAPFVVDSLKKLGRGVPVTAVFGNNDGEKLFLIKRFEEIGSIREGNIFTSFEGGKSLFMMHTHELPLELFKRKVFDIIIYGHTHDLHIEKNHRSIIINPGECGGWLRTKATVVVADTDTLETEVIYLT